MDKTIKVIAFISLMISFCIGSLLGRYVVPDKRPVPISERKDACEAKGGKYSYNWKGIGTPGYYYETCERTETEIKDF